MVKRGSIRVNAGRFRSIAAPRRTSRMRFIGKYLMTIFNIALKIFKGVQKLLWSYVMFYSGSIAGRIPETKVLAGFGSRPYTFSLVHVTFYSFDCFFSSPETVRQKSLLCEVCRWVFSAYQRVKRSLVVWRRRSLSAVPRPDG